MSRSAQIDVSEIEPGIFDVVVDEFVSAYRQATFEQRHQMFLEVFASQGADGLEFLAEAQARAEDAFFRGEL